MVREFNMLCSLRHQNIIRLYAAYETPSRLYLVTELATGGELMKRLGSDANHAVYSEDEVLKHVRTIAAAVAYMHTCNAVHRDLKPENVLLSHAGENAEIKIVDLGLARFFQQDPNSLMRTICGTHKYLAPELVHCGRGEMRGYDKAVDMWGVGLLTFVMLFGFNPFERPEQRETHDAIVKADFAFPDKYTVSQAARDFVRRLLRKRAEERYTAEQALAAPWLCGDMRSPGPLLRLSSPGQEERQVKALLSEFNARRDLGRLRVDDKAGEVKAVGWSPITGGRPSAAPPPSAAPAAGPAAASSATAEDAAAAGAAADAADGADGGAGADPAASSSAPPPTPTPAAESAAARAPPAAVAVTIGATSAATTTPSWVPSSSGASGSDGGLRCPDSPSQYSWTTTWHGWRGTLTGGLRSAVGTARRSFSQSSVGTPPGTPSRFM
eukprot:Transcript_30834.p1 GENE.Transcript_30834~~Transcript_30834.p1  ORF type:complete len:440 (-),score=158.92 Transcript_30834:570-1889(-)